MKVAKTKAPEVSEKDIQKQIKDYLVLHGYTVMETDSGRRSSVGRKGIRLPSGDPGLPDLFVSRKGYGNRWVALEVKRKAGRLSTYRAEQRELLDLGLTFGVDDHEKALQLVREVFAATLGEVGNGKTRNS